MTRVAFGGTKDQLTLAELSKKSEANSVVISLWKAEFLANLSALFKKTSSEEYPTEEVYIEKLYAQIGQLKVKNDFFLKKIKNKNQRC